MMQAFLYSKGFTIITLKSELFFFFRNNDSSLAKMYTLSCLIYDCT